MLLKKRHWRDGFPEQLDELLEPGLPGHTLGGARLDVYVELAVQHGPCQSYIPRETLFAEDLNDLFTFPELFKQDHRFAGPAGQCRRDPAPQNALAFGWDNPTAAVKLAWDRDSDIV